MTHKLHIKNNHAGPDTFPTTPESEPVFTISMEKYQQAAQRFPDLAAKLDVFVDWDERRTQQGFGVLAALGERRQVFVLTSRSEAADRLASAAGAHVLQMPTRKSGKRSTRPRTRSISASKKRP